MSATPTTRAWEGLYRANTSANGEQFATIGTVRARAIISELTADEIIAVGGTAQNGGYSVQMLASDFAAEPQKQQVATCEGPTIRPLDGLTVLDLNLNNGVYYIQVGDFVAQE